jgi:hypothetical protein
MVAVLSLHASAAWRVVIDPWTTKQVAQNTAAQKVIENKHNARLDSISARQKKLMEYSAAMASIKEVYRLTMQNVSGFGPETAYYKEIFSCATVIFIDVPQVMKAISKHPGRNYILCVSELNDVTMETMGLVHDFIDIVNNGKVRLPDNAVIRKNVPNGGGPYNMEKNDGYNFLDRYERLTLANRIYTRLMELRYKLEGMVLLCQYSSWDDVFFAIDPESWAAVFSAGNAVDGIIRDWNGLGV